MGPLEAEERVGCVVGELRDILIVYERPRVQHFADLTAAG